MISPSFIFASHAYQKQKHTWPRQDHWKFKEGVKLTGLQLVLKWLHLGQAVGDRIASEGHAVQPRGSTMDCQHQISPTCKLMLHTKPFLALDSSNIFVSFWCSDWRAACIASWYWIPVAVILAATVRAFPANPLILSVWFTSFFEYDPPQDRKHWLWKTRLSWTIAIEILFAILLKLRLLQFFGCLLFLWTDGFFFFGLIVIVTNGGGSCTTGTSSFGSKYFYHRTPNSFVGRNSGPCSNLITSLRLITSHLLPPCVDGVQHLLGVIRVLWPCH